MQDSKEYFIPQGNMVAFVKLLEKYDLNSGIIMPKTMPFVLRSGSFLISHLMWKAWKK